MIFSPWSNEMFEILGLSLKSNFFRFNILTVFFSILIISIRCIERSSLVKKLHFSLKKSHLSPKISIKDRKSVFRFDSICIDWQVISMHWQRFYRCIDTTHFDDSPSLLYGGDPEEENHYGCPSTSISQCYHTTTVTQPQPSRSKFVYRVSVQAK